MKRIQFYPNDVLERRLREEALKTGVSVSTLVNDLLNEHYGLTPKNKLSLSQLTSKVLNEVEKYLANPKSDREFDLLKASTTFKTIEMVCAGKPATVRANIGRQFAKKVGIAPFGDVKVALKPNGQVKKTVNNATIYEIIHKKSIE